MVLPVQAALHGLPVHQLCTYEWYCLQQGREHTFLSPDLPTLQNKACMATAAGRQARPSGTSKAEGMLLPFGLGKAEHLRLALEQLHKYGTPAKLEHDLEFTIEAVARCGPQVRLGASGGSTC